MPSVVNSNQSNLSLYSLYYAEARDELTVSHLPFIAPAVNIASFKEISQRWRVVGKTVFDLTSPRFESQTSRSKDKHVTAQSTG